MQACFSSSFSLYAVCGEIKYDSNSLYKCILIRLTEGASMLLQGQYESCKCQIVDRNMYSYATEKFLSQYDSGMVCAWLALIIFHEIVLIICVCVCTHSHRWVWC